MKLKELKLYFRIVDNVAELSTAIRLKVGALIVGPDNNFAYGYNGTPPKDDNNCEERVYIQDVTNQSYVDEKGENYILKTKRNVIHAEVNAIYNAAKAGIKTGGTSIFVSHSPCVACAEAISSAGITNVFYGQDYRDSDGLNYLRDHNIYVMSKEFCLEHYI